MGHTYSSQSQSSKRQSYLDFGSKSQIPEVYLIYFLNRISFLYINSISVVVSRVRPSFWPPLDGIRVLLGCGGVLYSLCTEMPSTAHAPGLLSTPLAREYVCQKCGKALPPLGIEPLPPAPKARALKGRAIWTLVVSLRYRRYI